MSERNIWKDAWKKLNDSIVTYRNNPIGTLASVDLTIETLNYGQVFTRDFAVSAFAFLLNDQPDKLSILAFEEDSEVLACAKRVGETSVH